METSGIILPVSKTELSNIIETAVVSAFRDCGLKKLPEKEKDLMNIKEAAMFLSMAVGTLYQKTHHKTIPYMKKGKKVYFSKKELTAWLQQGKREVNTGKTTTLKNIQL